MTILDILFTIHTAIIDAFMKVATPIAMTVRAIFLSAAIILILITMTPISVLARRGG